MQQNRRRVHIVLSLRQKGDRLSPVATSIGCAGVSLMSSTPHNASLTGLVVSEYHIAAMYYAFRQPLRVWRKPILRAFIGY